jgi:hypothetical protein
LQVLVLLSCTVCTITNDKRAGEEAAKKSEQTWQMALDTLKKPVEK